MSHATRGVELMSDHASKNRITRNGRKSPGDS